MEKKISKLEESIEAFIKSQTAFMQNQGQTLNSHSQAISRLEMQMSQLASSLSERPKGTLPSQPLANPLSLESSVSLKIMPRVTQGNGQVAEVDADEEED